MNRRKRVAQGFALVLVLAMISLTCVTGIDAKTKIKSKKVTLNVAKVTLSVGDIATLAATMKPTNSTDKLTWRSTDTKVASVNSNGVVTALAEGTTSVIVRTTSGKTAKCAVTVRDVLTRAQVEELVTSGILAEESIKKLITDNTLSEADVKKLITDNTLSEADVKKLITDNTPSEDDLKKLIKSETSEKTWTDNVEVPIMKGQALPMMISDTTATGIIGKISTIKVTKRHQASTVYNMTTKETMFLPYRYDIMLTADVGVITDQQKTTQFADITLGGPGVTDNLEQFRDNFIASFAANKMTELGVIYSAYDIDEFFIEKAVWKTK